MELSHDEQRREDLSLDQSATSREDPSPECSANQISNDTYLSQSAAPLLVVKKARVRIHEDPGSSHGSASALPVLYSVPVAPVAPGEDLSSTAVITEDPSKSQATRPQPSLGLVSSMSGESLSRDDHSEDKLHVVDNYDEKRFCECIRNPWSQFTNAIQWLITRSVVLLAVSAAHRPKTTLATITLLSFATITTGFFTNANMNVDFEEIYAPFDCLPLKHKAWINSPASGFPTPQRPLTLILHNNGDNVLGRKQMGLLFEALDVIRRTPGYADICSHSISYRNEYGEADCQIYSPTRFWNHDAALFWSSVETDRQAYKVLGSTTYPDGRPVHTELILGRPQYGFSTSDSADSSDDSEDRFLVGAESYFLRVNFPEAPGVEDFEILLLARLAEVLDEWKSHYNHILQFTYMTKIAYDLEFERAIKEDMPLVPIMVIFMSGFTCLVFARWKDRVQSRSILGFGAVMTVTMSLMTGYGLMFIIGLPFTSMTQILPFVILGVGLDDTFIITGAYFRTHPQKSIVQRIEETMYEVGPSISMTTFTTMIAFILGCISSIPAIRWVCLYAFPTIAIDFIYQVTYFVALLVLDERRVQANRLDCCVWSSGPELEKSSSFEWAEDNQLCAEEDEVDVDNPWSGNELLDVDSYDLDDSLSLSPRGSDIPKTVTAEKRLNFADEFMQWYAVQLMRPWAKALVMTAFMAYFLFCLARTTMLTQEFKLKELVPEGSHVADFMDSLGMYTGRGMTIEVYFRHVDQGDPAVQEDMRGYLHQLSELPAMSGSEPPFCWVLDFPKIQNDPRYSLMKNLTFNQALEFALTDAGVREAYGHQIVRDEQGSIVASRCSLFAPHLDLDVVEDQTNLLAQQRAITLSHPVNAGRATDDLAFFTYDSLYFLWEFYSVSIQELIFTTISGIFVVCFVGFFLIHHWSAVLFIFPMICFVYVDLLGTMQYAGLHINVLTYVCLVISIGLTVDFLMHVLLRYFESSAPSREEKVKQTLETMGASILLGGLSTFLGIIPLAFSTSVIIRTIFTAFLAMVTLGIAHGLILLPVVLSYLGPNVCIRRATTSECKERHSKKQENSHLAKRNTRHHARNKPMKYKHNTASICRPIEEESQFCRVSTSGSESYDYPEDISI